MSSKAGRNILGHCDLNNIFYLMKKKKIVENLLVLVSE